MTTQHPSSPQFQFLRPLLPVLVQYPGTTVSKHSNQFLQALVDIHDDREQLNTKLKSQTEASSTLPGSTPRSVGAAGLNEQSDTDSKVSRTWTSRLLFRNTFLRGDQGIRQWRDRKVEDQQVLQKLCLLPSRFAKKYSALYIVFGVGEDGTESAECCHTVRWSQQAASQAVLHHQWSTMALGQWLWSLYRKNPSFQEPKPYFVQGPIFSPRLGFAKSAPGQGHRSNSICPFLRAPLKALVVACLPIVYWICQCCLRGQYVISPNPELQLKTSVLFVFLITNSLQVDGEMVYSITQVLRQRHNWF